MSGRGQPRNRMNGRFENHRREESGVSLPAPVPGVLAYEELQFYAASFGVPDSQVERDHLISHVLGALSQVDNSKLIFFGGTALSRTHLTQLRLSEDIDLIARVNRTEIADEIQGTIRDALNRAFVTPSFTPELVSTRRDEPSVLTVGEITIQVQLLSSVGYPDWPTEVVDLEQRYSDAPPARMRVLTQSAFVASKLAAWTDRRASRDLYDLWALAERGAVDAEAKRLFKRFGPFSKVESIPFDKLPSEREWVQALGGQCKIQVGPGDAAATVVKELKT